MKNKGLIIISLILLNAGLIFNADCEAGTFAYLIDRTGKAARFDVEKNILGKTNQIEEISNIPILGSMIDYSVVADKSSNLLFIVEGRCRWDEWKQRIKVYDLKTLKFKKELETVSEDPDCGFPKIFVPPIYGSFFVQWWDRKKGLSSGNGEVNSVFDKSSLNKIKDITEPLSHYTEVGFSNDGTKMYGLDFRVPSSIRVYDTSNLSLINAISMKDVFNSLDTSKYYEDYRNEIFLFTENAKVTVRDPFNTHILHVFSVAETKKLQTINLGFNGDAKLTPDGKKMIITEKEYTYGTGSSYKTTLTGKIHIYDVLTGKEVGLISNFFGWLRAISPDSSKAYFIGKVAEDSYKLVIFDLNTYSKITEIPTTVTSYMVFFEE